MPKRKRDQDSLEEALSKHQVNLSRALKTAKAFERQRLAKRLNEKSTTEKKQRIVREISMLKSLDLRQTANAHLLTSLLKVGSIAKLPELPGALRQETPKLELSEEQKALFHNVTSNLYNRLGVKKMVQGAVDDICRLLRLSVVREAKSGLKEGGNDASKSTGGGVGRDDSMAVEGSSPQFSSISLASPSPSSSSDQELSSSATAKVPRPKPEKPDRRGESTFLPSLMGGYVSGSESASDVDVAPSKKRLGQRARQAIWEKKFGANANHFKSQKRQQEKERHGRNMDRDDGWDLRKGAIGRVGEEEDGLRTAKPWEGGAANLSSKRGADRVERVAESRNGQQSDTRDWVVKAAKDDTKPMHPSWEAKARQKTREAQALRARAPEQKIIFD